MASFNYEMLFAGFGGQGVLFSGKVAAYCGLLDEHEVSWLPSYGPEMRGGTANCSVCISESPIGSPMVTQPDVLVVMNGPSFDKFVEHVVPGGLVITDATLVERTTTRTDIRIFPVEATRLSNEQHLEGIPNVILLGKLLKEVPFTSLETMHKALQKGVPERKAHLLKENFRAIELGMSQ